MRGTLTHARAPIVLLASVALLPESRPVPLRRRDRRRRPFPTIRWRATRWHLELTVHGAVEDLRTTTATTRRCSASSPASPTASAKAWRSGWRSPLYYVWQRGTDGYLFGLTGGLRGRLVKKPRWSAFWEFEVGVSEADTYVPPRGTRFNYLAIGGGGVTVRIRPGIHLLGGLRCVHVSNNSLAGRSRNPDIEAFGPTIGLLYGF